MTVEQNSYDLDFRSNILTVTKQKREHKFIDVALKKKKKNIKKPNIVPVAKQCDSLALSQNR